MPVKRLTVLISALGLACCLALPVWAAKVPLFDDFSGTEINAGKWRESEALRHVNTAGRLVLGRWTYGDTASDTGIVVDNFVMTTTDSAPARGMAATFTAVDIDPVGQCAANPRPSSSMADMGVVFFNTQPGGGVPGDQTGDVIGNVILRTGAGPNLLFVIGNAVHCLNSTCSALENIGFADLGTVGTGQAVSLEVDWDRTNHRFLFIRGKNPPISSPYTLPVGGIPSFAVKNLFIHNETANCQAGRLKAGMTVWIDDVRIGH